MKTNLTDMIRRRIESDNLISDDAGINKAGKLLFLNLFLIAVTLAVWWGASAKLEIPNLTATLLTLVVACLLGFGAGTLTCEEIAGNADGRYDALLFKVALVSAVLWTAVSAVLTTQLSAEYPGYMFGIPAFFLMAWITTTLEFKAVADHSPIPERW